MKNHLYALLLITLAGLGSCKKESPEPKPTDMLATNQGRDWKWLAYEIGPGPAPVPTCISSGTLRFYSDGEFQHLYPPVVTECQWEQGTWRFLSDEVFVIKTQARTDTFQLKELTENRLVFGRDSVFTGPLHGTYFVQYTYYR